MKASIELIEEAINEIKASSEKAINELRLLADSNSIASTNDALWDMLHCMSLLRAKHPEAFEVLNLNKRIEEASEIARNNNFKLKRYESDIQD